ncbi:MAG: phosphotransferase [Prevotella sp.]|nr:phosphotransferase [Prevotella sp.]
MNRLFELYKTHFGAYPQKAEKIAAAGSNRQYFRLSSEAGNAVGTIGTSKEENRAFIGLARYFRSRRQPVPEVYAVSSDGMCYLQQDLGALSLYDALKNGRAAGNYNEEEKALLRRVMQLLPAFQTCDGGLDYSVCPIAAFDRESVFFDLNYFKYCFLKPSGADFDERSLERAFEQFATDLCSERLAGFMYRDFQARNVMLAGGEPYFIDFQGGRRGPLYYDLASFLWQASARYDSDLRRELAEVYYNELHALRNDIPPRETFMSRLKTFALFRTLQVLGAYGFRGWYERKTYFTSSIPAAIANLRELLNSASCNEGYLREVLEKLTSLPAFLPKAKSTKLSVRIVSFAYKNGIPGDDSGNGGGYVFDCRAANNPGRHPEFRTMTGRDEPVIRFIEADGELPRFLKNIYPIAEAHVARWLERGFTDLLICFGCTGGRHRSVYAAEHLARRLNEKFGVEIKLCHREQGIETVLPAAQGEGR